MREIFCYSRQQAVEDGLLMELQKCDGWHIYTTPTAWRRIDEEFGGEAFNFVRGIISKKPRRGSVQEPLSSLFFEVTDTKNGTFYTDGER